jgi:hypothetical protein
MRLISAYFARIQLKIVRRLFAAGTALSPPGLSVVILVTRPAVSKIYPFSSCQHRDVPKSSMFGSL